MANVIKEKQDLTFLQWSKIRNSSGAAGSFLKAYSDISGKKKYYKLSNYNSVDGVKMSEKETLLLKSEVQERLW